MNKTLRNCAVIGSVLGALAAAQIGLSHVLWSRTDSPAPADSLTPEDQATAQRNLAKCERDLHAAQSQGYTWTFVPVGYDRDGNPAIKVRGVLAHWRQNGVSPGTLVWLVKATECYASKGEWWDRPINIIADTVIDNDTIARYDGQGIK